jgi:hypothetical protein
MDARPADDLSAEEVLGLLGAIDARGAFDAAKRARQVAGQVFRYLVDTVLKLSAALLNLISWRSAATRSVDVRRRRKNRHSGFHPIVYTDKRSYISLSCI